MTKGGLEESRSLLSSTDAVIATESRVRNSLGRALSETDGRSGITAFGNFTPAGQARSVLQPGARLSHFTFDALGRQLSLDAPDTPLSSNVGGGTCSNISRTSYWPTGQLKARWGDQTNAVYYLYDEQGRMTGMRTYRTLAHNIEPADATGGSDSTTWNYDPSRGFLTGKLDAANKGALYSCTDAGRLRTRKWARGAWTRYDYHPASGYLTARRYFTAGTSEATVLSAALGNDTQTPDVDFTFDSLGRTEVVTSFLGHSPRVEFTRNQFHYTANMTLDSEDIRVSPNGSGVAPEVIRTLDRQEDSLHRSKGWSLSEGASTHSNVYEYHPAEGRMLSVSGSGGTFTYGYTPGSGALVQTVTGPVHTVTNTWMTDRDALDIKENKVGGTVISKYDYAVNALNQRSGVSISGSAFGVPVGSPQTTAWGYDALGQVVSADHPTAAAKDFGYAFDRMGNRTRSSRSVLNPASASGASLAVYRSGTGAGSIEGGTGLNQHGRLELYGKVADNNTYDDDGNQRYGRFANINLDTGRRLWDGENRLIYVEPDSAPIATYVYDVFSRRVGITRGSGTAITLYDGWNAVADYSPAATPVLQTAYTWGPDLSGSSRGAGGVGGLLAVKQYLDAPGIYYPTCDGNGNISEYLDSSGTVAAHFEYGPFGETTGGGGYGSGPYSHLFKYRFSTKSYDEETGYYYYGYRFYDPVCGRWISRDPAEEKGGLHLYGFVENDGIGKWDYIGLMNPIIS